MEIVVFVVVLIGGALVLDRFGLWAERRGWIYWRHRRGSADAGAGMLAYMDSLFAPAKETTIAEQQSKQIVRVDLSAPDALGPAEGKIRLRAPARPAGESDSR